VTSVNNNAKARGPSRLLPFMCSQPESDILQTDLHHASSFSEVQIARTSIDPKTQNAESEALKGQSVLTSEGLKPERADKSPQAPCRQAEAAACRESGVRLKWGEKLENGKGVVADADPPRTMPSQITTPQSASHAPLYAILAHSSIILFNATSRAEQKHSASDGMLCHNMCRPIRVIRELDVELTFDGARESTRALHLTGLLAHSRVPPLTCQYIYVKCT
jgi:hypothetical protein